MSREQKIWKRTFRVSALLSIVSQPRWHRT